MCQVHVNTADISCSLDFFDIFPENIFAFPNAMVTCKFQNNSQRLNFHIKVIKTLLMYVTV